ncbi:MAG TPA: hypothetical protein VF939_26870 [Puia sp.]
MDTSIMPECYADTLLIETLVPSKKGYNHKHNCFKVEDAVKNSGRFAVGIIDKDKKQIKYLSYFEIIDKVDGSLILWRHRSEDKHHFMIQICPALERWILNICEAESIKLSDFGFKNGDLEDLKKYTKSRSSMQEENLITLFKAINKKSENISVRKLKSWITLLKEKNYRVDIKELTNG